MNLTECIMNLTKFDDLMLGFIAAAMFSQTGQTVYNMHDPNVCSDHDRVVGSFVDLVAVVPTVDEIVKMSKGGTVEYDTIEYRGVKLLITISKIKPLVAVTYEFTHDPAAQKLAQEMGIKLKGARGIK